MEPFDGDLDDYQRYLLEESKRLREQAKLSSLEEAASASQTVAVAEAAAPSVDPREQRRLAAQARQLLADKTKPFKKELDQIDKHLPQLTAERSDLEARLSTQGLSGADIAEAGKQLKQVNDTIDTLEERWLELSEQIEAIAQELGATA
ncbi:hypothetical protein SDC9_156916 [bioreactor metagenome]|uniref:ABC transporter Uup C-terminal domain-containing protein n=1 Tax=bioreactor metagenome TaxID=1076179 RepID=A0A645F5K0_9ZZZZ